MITFYQIHSLCQITHPPPIHHLAVDGTYYALRTKSYINYQNEIETRKTPPPNFTNTPRHLNKGMVNKKYIAQIFKKHIIIFKGLDVSFQSILPASTPIVKRRLSPPR